jgi:uncharacterized protein (DUF362 family)
MGKVSLVRATRGIRQGLCEAVELIGGFGRYIQSDDTVLVKPNLNGADGFTNRELSEALLQLLFDFRVKRVFLAESTFGDERSTDMLFRKTGYFDLARKYGVDLVNLNRSRIVEARVERPLALQTLRIAGEVYEADKIINLPNMKVHYAAGITFMNASCCLARHLGRYRKFSMYTWGSCWTTPVPRMGLKLPSGIVVRPVWRLTRK